MLINELLIETQNDLLFIEDTYYKKDKPLHLQGDFLDNEYEAYYNITKCLKPTSVLEVGVYRGYSACTIMLAAPQLVKYVGLDSEEYMPETNQTAKEYINRFISKYKDRFPNLSCIDYKLFKVDTIKENALELLDGAMFDWVHIDAGHTTEEAYKDVVTFWPVTKKVLTLHDVGFLPCVTLASNYLKNKVLDRLLCTSTVNSSRGFELFIKSF